MVTNAESAPTRESIALAEVGHTDVSRGTVIFLLMFFLLSVAAVPLFELASGRATSRAGGTAPWEHLTRLAEELGARVQSEAAGAGAWKRLLVGNRVLVQALVAFEDALEDDSRLGRLMRPPTQLFMSRWLGAGNERAYTGRGDWLFYRPDVEYVTGRGFLDPRSMARRVALTDQWTTPPQPDPRKAIVAFNQQLDARGITLIVMPTPVKPVMHPEQLAQRLADAHLPLQNASYAAFVDDLRRNGILVFDAAGPIAEAISGSGSSQYLATDTHWRPEAMEAVAARLADFIRSHAQLPERTAALRVEPREVSQLGDIAVMLDLPKDQALYPPETITVRRVLLPDGTPWRPARDADVLLLGDSFSNVYSLASMGWGESAGFVEHVSLALQRPLDRIVQNDQGSHATRELLRRAGDERLAGKRVVVYQFAVRELMFGDWKLFDERRAQ